MGGLHIFLDIANSSILYTMLQKSTPQDKAKIKSAPVRKWAYNHLKSDVLSGHFKPGERLTEEHLAKTLGVSRTPVREAIHKLDREGLLEHNRSGGFFVVGLNRSDIEETFGIRAVLDSYAARLAAIKHREKDLEPLEEKLNEYQIFLDRGEMDALPGINTEFHERLYALSNSPRLIKMINDLRDHVYRFRQVLLKSKEWARASNDDHRQLLKLLRKRDADGVEKLVREHILRGRKVVLDEFDMEQ